MDSALETLTAPALRRIILEQSKRANVGHIGSALSVVDIVCALYGQVLRIPAPSDPDRDRFIMSKGHAVLALYAALHLRGWISHEELETYAGDGTLLGMHPEHRVPGIDFSTGSLGHGLSIGAGAALAARLQGSPPACLRAAQRRGVQRGVGMGGGHVRRAPPSRRTSSRSST